MPRNLIIKGHVQGWVNLVARDGEAICHLLVDGPEGDAFADSIPVAMTIHDDNDPASWSRVAAKYKRRDGEPLHVFAGVPIQRIPVVSEAPEEPVT